MNRRHIAIAASTLSLAVGAVVGGATSASATSAGAACGSQYTHVEGSSSFYGGSVWLLWQPGTSNYCAVTLKSKDVGTPTETYVYLVKDALRNAPVSQSGLFKYYAGPVYWSNQPGYPACAWGGAQQYSSKQICGYEYQSWSN